MRIRMVKKRDVITSSRPLIRIRSVISAPKPTRHASVPLRKAVWRRITDTRRRRDNRIRQQNLIYGNITTIPVTDPSDSGSQGDPSFSRPETSTSRPDRVVIAAPSSSPARPQDDVQYSDVSSPVRSHASRVSIVDDTDVEDQESGEISEDSLEDSKRSLTQFSPKKEVIVDPSEMEIPEL